MGVKLKEYLRQKVKASPLTQEEIASRLDVKPVNVSNWINPDKSEDVPARRVKQLTELLDLDLREVLSHEDPERLLKTAGVYLEDEGLTDVIRAFLAALEEQP
jgi:transcriptional regulator with XRE-family HTH domain